MMGKTVAEGRKLAPVKTRTMIIARIIDWIIHHGTSEAYVYNSRHVFVAGVSGGGAYPCATAKLYDAQDFIDKFIQTHTERVYYEIVSGIWQPPR
jgi:hypothetical protein